MVAAFIVRLMSRAKLSMRFKLEPEQLISIQFADAMRAKTLDGSFKGVWKHTPNEGKRSRIVAMIMRAMGMIPGAADYDILFEKTVFIELKVKPNKQTDSQKDFQAWAESAGHSYQVCYSAEEALEFLDSLGAFKQIT